MTDSRLRELERRFRESGSVEDEAAWLRERRRGGQPSDERLRLAAWLGNEASRVLVEESPQPPSRFRALIEALSLWGPEATMRASIAAARLASPILGPLLRPSDPEYPLPVVEAAEQSVVCPCLPHAQALMAVAERCEAAAQGPNAVQLSNSRVEAAWRTCTAPAALLTNGARPWWGPEYARLAFFTDVAREDGDADDGDSILKEAGLRVREAIRAELLPWALGTGDPVRERVDAR